MVEMSTNLQCRLSALVAIHLLTAGFAFAQLPNQGCLSGRLYDAGSGALLRGRLVLGDQGVREVEGEFRVCDIFATDTKIMASAEDHISQYYPGIDLCAADEGESQSLYQQAAVVSIGPGKEPRVEFPLHRGGSLAGRITSRETGAPVAGARIEVYRFNGRGYSGGGWVESDLTGAYVIPGGVCGGDQYKVRVSAERYLPALSGDPDCSTCDILFEGSRITIAGEGQTRLDFALREAMGTVTGHVIDRFTRKPIEGARVINEVTGVDGSYSLELERKPFRIWAEAEGYARQVYPCAYHCELEETPPIAFGTGGTMVVDFELSTMDLVRVIPSWSTPAGGETARIEGVGLDDVTALWIDGTSVPIRAANETFVEFRIPAHPEGAVSLRVADGDGRSYELMEGLTYWKGSQPRRIRDIEKNRSIMTEAVPDEIVAMGGAIYFAETDTRDGRELWRSDGTGAGTTMVKDIEPIAGHGSSPAGLVVLRSSLYFSASGMFTLPTLWRTDGTESGTSPVLAIDGSVLTAPDCTAAVNGSVYLQAIDPAGARWLWRIPSEGSRAQPILRVLSSSECSEFGHLGTRVVTGAAAGPEGQEPWITDGTPQGTHLLGDLYPGNDGSKPDEFTELNGRVFFAATTNWGRELIVSDGSPSGTRMVVDLQPGQGGSFPRYLVAFNGRLYFEAASPNGVGIWSTDGTEKGTRFLVAGGGPIVAYRNALYFIASNRLMRTDGTTSVLVSTVRDGRDLSVANDHLWFSAEGQIPCEAGVTWCRPLWVSDGTSSGTRPVDNIWWAGAPFSLGARTCFAGRDPHNVGGLWCGDAGGNSISLVWNFDPVPLSRGSNPMIEPLSEKIILIAATTVESGTELWTSNLREEGTVLLTDIAPGPESGFTPPILAAGSQYFFRGITPWHGRELWVTDGRPENTHEVVDLTPGVEDGVGWLLFAGGDSVYFTRPGPDGESLWRSDGSATGTRQILEAVPSVATAWKGALVFAGNRSVNGCVVCRMTPSGSFEELWQPEESRGWDPDVSHLDVVGDRLFLRTSTSGWSGMFSLGEGPSARLTSQTVDTVSASQSGMALFHFFQPYGLGKSLEVFWTDGTPAGTTLLGTIGPLQDTNVTASGAGSRVFFRVEPLAGNSDLGVELWVTDGRSLELVRRLRSMASEMAGTPEGGIFFSGRTPGTDWEVWQSDGTSEGTRLAWDVNREGPSNPRDFHVVGPYLLFSAEAPENDREPWVVQYRPPDRKRRAHRP